MVQGIAEIIHKDFFRLEFISPYINRCILFKADSGIILPDEDLRRLDVIVDQHHYIKAFHCYYFIAEFQLIQREKLFHHIIHFPGFIYDNVAVKIPAFLVVVIDPFL